MIKVFISGKMTGEPNYNREKFFEVEEELKQEDLFIVLNPAVLPDGLKHEEYMSICYAMIDVCDMVVMLSGWEHSKGAMMERGYAIANNKAVNEWKEWYQL